MCLIVHKPANTSFPLESAEVAYGRTNGGFSCMYVEDGRVKVHRGMYTIDDMNSIIEDSIPYDAAYFFRSKSYHEAMTVDDLQPYQLLDKEEHGIDLFAIHTGYINNLIRTAIKNETYHYIHNYLKPILIRQPSLIYQSAFTKFLTLIMTNFNKMVVLDSNNQWIIFNKNTGIEFSGCWLSNDYSHIKYAYHNAYAHGDVG